MTLVGLPSESVFVIEVPPEITDSPDGDAVLVSQGLIEPVSKSSMNISRIAFDWLPLYSLHPRFSPSHILLCSGNP